MNSEGKIKMENENIEKWKEELRSFLQQKNDIKNDCYGCVHHEEVDLYGDEYYNKCKLLSTPEKEFLHDNDGCEKRVSDVVRIDEESIEIYSEARQKEQAEIDQWQVEYQKAMDLAASEAILKADVVIENKKLKAELAEKDKEIEKVIIRLAELEDISNTILKGLDKGIPTVQKSFPHNNLIFYFTRYRNSARQYFKQKEEVK